MQERISISEKELYRLQELSKAHEKRQTLSQTAENLELGLRQVKRLSKRMKLEGVSGLVSKRTGKASNHQLPPELKGAALSFIREKYSDFGPTLAHEYLFEKDHLCDGMET